jgi:hypothetical protein
MLGEDVPQRLPQDLIFEVIAARRAAGLRRGDSSLRRKVLPPEVKTRSVMLGRSPLIKGKA